MIDIEINTIIDNALERQIPFDRLAEVYMFSMYKVSLDVCNQKGGYKDLYDSNKESLIIELRKSIDKLVSEQQDSGYDKEMYKKLMDIYDATSYHKNIIGWILFDMIRPEELVSMYSQNPDITIDDVYKCYQSQISTAGVIEFSKPNDTKTGFLHDSYMSQFVVDNVTFPCVYHYEIYAKARYFEDEESANDIIINIHDRPRIKEMGKHITGYINSVWNIVRENELFDAVYNKYMQNNKILEDLIKTDRSLLVLTNDIKNDSNCVWGVGDGTETRNYGKPDGWEGLNLKGKLLTHVRYRIQKEEI